MAIFVTTKRQCARGPAGSTVVVINADAVKIAGEKYLLITGQDITERKRAQESLRRSEEKFSVLFEKAPFAVAVSRFKDSVFIDVNEEFLRMLGFAKEEVLGKTDVDINMIPDPNERAAVLMELQASGGKLRQREIRMRSKDGRNYVVLINADIVQIAGEMHLLATCEDITERKQSEEALQRAKAQLQEHATNLEQTVAERTAELKETNEQLEAFVYSIAHDLRAPLRAMQGYAHILLEDLAGKLPETDQKFLSNIHHSAEYMDRMILDLLAFGRTARTDIELRSVDVQKIWDAARFQCADQIEQTGAHIETVKPLPTVRAHDATLTQVLANLLSNAMKFMKAGVRPEIRFWAEDRRPQRQTVVAG